MNSNAHTKLRNRGLIGLSALLAGPTAFGQLKIDFSNSEDHVDPGYSGYIATHENLDSFTQQGFPAFGETIQITPNWTDSTEATVRQLILRGDGNNANWLGDRVDLLKDWIGTDTRTANGGNGDFDGITGSPTTFTLTLSGLPDGDYNWISYHHDTEHVFTSFTVAYSSNGGTTFTDIPGTFVGTDSTTGGTPASPQIYTGSTDPNPANLPSTAQFEVTAIGGQDLVLKFTPLSQPGVHQQIWAMNGFELSKPGDTDGDGMPDTYEVTNGLDPNVNDANDDLDGDDLTNIQEYRGADGTEGTGDETNPNSSDTDGDGVDDGDEVNIFTSNPLNKDTDGDYYSDGDEVTAGTSPTDAGDFPIPTGGLFIDFSSNGGNQTGPVHDVDYLPYVATDRTAGEVDHVEIYPTTAFGGSNDISFEVSFPNPGGGVLPPDATRMIGRTDAAAGQYPGLNQAMIRDWIGFDNRTGSGGNGGAEDSQMLFTFTGFPAGQYLFVSHHHDLGSEQGDFTVSVTDANRNDEAIFTKSGTANNVVTVTPGSEPSALLSTSNFIFESNGPATPVIIRFSSREVAQAFEGFVVVNGLEITQILDSDNDGLPDDVEDSIAGLDKNTADSGLDLDSDFLTNLEEYYLGTDIDQPDPDNDDLLDGEEINTYGTNPFNPDTDGDGLTDGQEVNDFGSNPLNANSDGDSETLDVDGSGNPNKYSDFWEFVAGSNPLDGADYPDLDGDGYSASVTDEDDSDIDVFPLPALNQLFVDFNSNQNGGGDSSLEDSPADSEALNNQRGYLSYHANHEAIDQFTTATYEVFGSNVTLTPSWPDSSGINTTQQSIDRAAGNDRNWHGDKINLLSDWIGIDTRTGVGGNGPYDGVTGNPTRLFLTLGNLPGANFFWRSYHHDTENVHTDFTVRYSTDGGTTFTEVAGPNDNGSFSMSDSTAGGTPNSAQTYTGIEQGYIDPVNLPGTVEFNFAANGSDDVIIEFTPLSTDQVHTALLAVNGFELTGPAGLGSGVTILDTGFTDTGFFEIDFRGAANTDYEVLKSTSLNSDFVSIGVETDTDGSGLGTISVPPASASDSKAFFIIQPVTE